MIYEEKKAKSLESISYYFVRVGKIYHASWKGLLTPYMAKVFRTETKPRFQEGVRLLSRDLTLYDLRYGVKPGFSKVCSIEFCPYFHLVSFPENVQI